MALSFTPARFTEPAPEPTPESRAKLDKVIGYCEGMVQRYAEAFEPVYDLAISLRAAHRFLDTKIDKQGFCIIKGFNFHEIMAGEDVAITLPAYIGKHPVVAMADVDFDRLGMQMRSRLDAIPSRALVKALVFPQTMKLVGRGIVNSLAPRHIFVSAGVTELDATGLATTISYLGPRSAVADPAPLDRMVTTDHSLPAKPTDGADFTVHPDNPAYRSIDGNLYTRDLETLKFLALPYPAEVVLPDGLRAIDRNAYVYGHTGALTIHVPDSLEDAVFSPSSNCLWVCSHETAFFHMAQERGWMVATKRRGQEGAIAYDVLDDGTVRILRVQGHPTHLDIPDTVAGLPVTSLGNNALPRSVESLVLPASMTEICGYVTAENLRHLTLPAYLERIGAKAFSAARLDHPIVIPASCTEIGRGSFGGGGTAVFAATGTEVLLDPSFAPACFASGTPPFDFTRYDNQVSAYSNQTQRMRALLVRLANPYGLSEDAKAEFQSYLVGHMFDAIAYIERTGSLDVLDLVLSTYSWDASSLDRFAAQMNDAGQTECTIAIMNRRHELFGHRDAAGSGRFSL